MLSYWKRKFKNVKLSKKMLITYAAFAGISCVISMAALQVSLNIYDEKLYEKSLQELDFFTQQVNSSLEDVEELSLSIAMDSDVQEQLRKMQTYEYLSVDYSLGLYHLRELITDELIDYPYIQNVVYTDGNLANVKAGQDTGEVKKEQIEQLLSEFHDVRGGYIYQNPTKDYPYLLSGRDILERKNASLDYLGSLIITCDIAKIIEDRNDSLEAAHNFLYVYSKDGTIYLNSEKTKLLDMGQLSGNSGYDIIHYRGEKYFRCYLRSGVNHWVYVNIFPYSDIFGQTMMLRYLLIGGFAILFFCMVLAMNQISVWITQPLHRLTESMKILEKGDFKEAKTVLDKEPGNDEVGMLAQEFRVMLDKIDILIHENYEKQLLLQETKYKMLQAQINPHFLYNTLNTLNWMVKGKKNEDATKVIVGLGKILRASFDQNPYTTVKEELEVARGYIVIQEYRYQNRAQFIVQEEGQLECYMIPRMILQPLIENAIYYGVDNTLKNCKITVRVKELENAIVLSVEDTGPGIKKEELEKLRNDTAIPKGHGIGIKNIKERLKITYEKSEFKIDSQIGHGTRVYIKIPKVKVEVKYV